MEAQRSCKMCGSFTTWKSTDNEYYFCAGCNCKIFIKRDGTIVYPDNPKKAKKKKREPSMLVSKPGDVFLF